MSAVVMLRGEEHPVAAGQTLAQALQSLGLHPESWLAVRDGQMIATTEIIHAGDVIRLVAVISGGQARVNQH